MTFALSVLRHLIASALVPVIKAVLWVIDPDHRKRERIGGDGLRKFTHVVEQDFQSDFGRCVRAFRTVPYEAWELRTATRTLLAADRHLVIREDREPVWIEKIQPGDRIMTVDGPEVVVSCRPLGVRVHMYCLEVATEDSSDPNNHLYHANGVLSHNTTVATAYLLWKAMFTPDATILICANKYDMALEIMHRIRYAYENLPDHIRAGTTEYNKGSIVFDNGARIVSRATSKDAARGLSVTLCYVDEFAFVPPNKASEFWTSIRPTMATGGSCIVTSTPMNDEDQFAQIWKLAIDNTDEFGNPRPNGLGKNGFKALCYPWTYHPERHEGWADEERASIGEAKFRQEHCCVTGDTLLTLRGPDGAAFQMTIRELTALLARNGGGA